MFKWLKEAKTSPCWCIMGKKNNKAMAVIINNRWIPSSPSQDNLTFYSIPSENNCDRKIKHLYPMCEISSWLIFSNIACDWSVTWQFMSLHFCDYNIVDLYCRKQVRGIRLRMPLEAVCHWTSLQNGWVTPAFTTSGNWTSQTAASGQWI